MRHSKNKQLLKTPHSKISMDIVHRKPKKKKLNVSEMRMIKILFAQFPLQILKDKLHHFLKFLFSNFNSWMLIMCFDHENTLVSICICFWWSIRIRVIKNYRTLATRSLFYDDYFYFFILFFYDYYLVFLIVNASIWCKCCWYIQFYCTALIY